MTTKRLPYYIFCVFYIIYYLSNIVNFISTHIVVILDYYMSKKTPKKGHTKAQQSEANDDKSYGAMSPEQIKIKTKYAITINPSDDYQYWNKEDRVNLFKTYWQNSINKMSAEIHMILEISKTGRLHWHGYITFHTKQNILDFYVDYMHDLMSRSMVLIKNIEDEEGWEAYLTKCKHLIDEKIGTTDAAIKRLSNITKLKKQMSIPGLIPMKEIPLEE